MTMEKGIVKKSILSLCTVLALLMTMPFSVFAESEEIQFSVYRTLIIDSASVSATVNKVTTDITKNININTNANSIPITSTGTGTGGVINRWSINPNDWDYVISASNMTDVFTENTDSIYLAYSISSHYEYHISFNMNVTGVINIGNSPVYFTGSEYVFNDQGNITTGHTTITPSQNFVISPSSQSEKTITVEVQKSPNDYDLQPIIDQLNSLNNRYNIPLSSFSAYDGWLNYGSIIHPENFNSALSLMDYNYPPLSNFNIDWDNKVFRCYKGHNVFAFYWPYQFIYNLTSNRFEDLFNMTENGYARSINRSYKYIPMGKGVIQVYEWDYTGSQASFSYGNNQFYNNPSTIIVPLFCGSDVTMNDDLKNLLSIQTVSEIESNQKNEQLKTESQKMFDFEDQMGEQMNQSLSQIQLRDPATFGSSFAQTANWVRDQFNMLTLQSLTGDANPVGSIIVFSLSLGLAMLIIGRGMFR